MSPERDTTSLFILLEEEQNHLTNTAQGLIEEW